MKSIFDIEGKFFRLLSNAIDCFYLNFLFIITSLPIVTLGCAWTTVLSVYLSKSRKNDRGVTKLYFEGFKANLKHATGLEFLLLGISGVIFYIANILFRLGLLQSIGLIVVTPLLLVASLFLACGFPYIACYKDSFANILKICFSAFAVAPLQVVQIIVLNCGVLLLVLLSFEGMLTALYVFTFFGFSAMAFLNARLSLKVFSKLELSLEH